MQQSYIFGGNTGLSYDQIQKQRDIANELLRANMSTPQNVGEGLSAIGRALAAKAIDKRTSRADEANRAASAERRASAFGSIFGGAPSGGSAPYSSPSQPPVVFDPNSPQGVASDAMAALGKSVFTPGDRESFVSAMMPHALRVSEMTGLDPRLVIAQAAQETGWGKSAPNNNFFGIKSHGKGGGANLGTFEYVDGNRVNVNDSFRTYGGMGESAEDYARFLMENPRYKEMLAAGDLEGQLAALGRSGYATDPNYAASVGSIASSIQIPGMAPAQPAAAGGNMSMGNPATIQMIADLLADPYTPPGEKAMLEQAMAMQLQGMDPMRQLEMEKTRLELDQMRNPQPGFRNMTDEEEIAAGLDPSGVYQKGREGNIVTVQAPAKPSAKSRIVTGEEAAALGLDPSLRYNLEEGPDGRKASPIGGGQTINRTDPAPPAGYRNVYDDQNRLIAQEPIPGSPAAMEAEAAARKAEVRSGMADGAGDTAVMAAQRALTADNERAVGGTLGAISAYIPETQSAEVYRQVDALKAMASIEALTAMRNSSPTGAGMGNPTDRDAVLLEQKHGALDPKSPYFQRDLLDYTRALLRTIHGQEAGDAIFEDQFGGTTNSGPDEDGWQTINGVKIRVKQ